MDSRNDCRMMQLNAISVEYYLMSSTIFNSGMAYDVFTLYYDQLRFVQTGMVCSSFNIQYQSTGVDSLPSLDEFGLERSIRGFFLSTYGTFRWTCL